MSSCAWQLTHFIGTLLSNLSVVVFSFLKKRIGRWFLCLSQKHTDLWILKAISLWNTRDTNFVEYSQLDTESIQATRIRRHFGTVAVRWVPFWDDAFAAVYVVVLICVMAWVSELEVRNIGKLRPENTISCFLNVISILINYRLFPFGSKFHFFNLPMKSVYLDFKIHDRGLSWRIISLAKVIDIFFFRSCCELSNGWQDDAVVQREIQIKWKLWLRLKAVRYVWRYHGRYFLEQMSYYMDTGSDWSRTYGLLCA